ncbi:radical SAM protein, partial [Candidatus Micrarchaeota archaeon]|nr:radical SAM protein [Candidatus Micrarchaeota archaeon]
AYAARTAIKVTLAPVVVGGNNEGEKENIVVIAKEIVATVGAQNYLYYKKGRNPKDAKQIQWPDFYGMLGKLQEKHGVKLVLSELDYEIIKTKPLPKPFKKGQIVKATVISEGRYPKEYIAAAEERVITLPNCDNALKTGEKIKVKIESDKHNIFYGKAV